MTINAEYIKRTLRTLFHSIIALGTIVPLALKYVPSNYAAQAAVIAGAVAAVTGFINKLEDSGVIPAWLKDTAVAPAADPTDAPSVADDSADPAIVAETLDATH